MARTVEQIEQELLANPAHAEVKSLINDVLVVATPTDRLAAIHKWAVTQQAEEVKNEALAKDKADRAAKLAKDASDLSTILTKIQAGTNLSAAENRTLLRAITEFVLPQIIAAKAAEEARLL